MIQLNIMIRVTMDISGIGYMPTFKYKVDNVRGIKKYSVILENANYETTRFSIIRQIGYVK